MDRREEKADLLRAALERHSEALRAGLERVLLERTFPPHPRFRGGGLFDDIAGGTLGGLQMELVEAWVRASWLAVRAVAPDLRGFVSEHDGGEITDLDTGERCLLIRDIGLDYL